MTEDYFPWRILF